MKKLVFLMLLVLLALGGCQPKGPETTYTITFDANGGSAVAAIQIDGKSHVTSLENPTKEGYIFDGWFFDNDTFLNEFFTDTLTQNPITTDIILYAKWEVAEFRLTYSFENPIDDTTVTHFVDYDYGQTIATYLPTTYEGYTFAGWYFDQLFANPITDIFLTMPANHITLYGRFVAAEYAIRFLDYDNTIIYEEMVAYQASLSHLDEISASREGYNFIGWSSEIPETMPARLLLMYAQYEVNQYTIAFDTGVGSQVDELTTDFGAEIIAPSAPSRLGYAFSGWFVENTHQTPYTFSTMPAENMTLYAKWDIVTYDLSFDDNLTILTEMQFESKEAFLNEFYTDFNTWFDLNLNHISALTKSGDTFTLTLNGSTATWSNIAQMRDLDIYVVEKTLGNFIYKPFTRVGNDPVDPVEDSGYFLNTEPYRTKYQDCDRYFLNVILTSYTAYDKGYNPASAGRVQIFFRFHQWNKGTAIAAFNTLPTKIDKQTINDGTITLPDNRTYTVLDEIELPLLTHTSMNFLGWFEHPLGAGEAITKIEKGSVDNKVVYARWDINPSIHEIIYLDYHNNIIKTEQLTPGQAATPPVAPNLVGFIFIGWDKSMDSITKDTTFTAQYEVITYTITFDANIEGDVTLPDPLVYTAEASITLPHPSLDGYLFIGWYANSGLTGEMVTHTSSGNKTLYARWVKIPTAGEEPIDTDLTVVASEPIVMVGRSSRIYVKNSDGEYLNPNSVLFFSAHPTIATIDSTGFVTTHGTGKATIFVIVGEEIATFEIEVTNEANELRWVGHQGSGGPFVQNTTEAFIEGALRGYYALESDIRVSSDGVYYICHDDTFLPYLFVDPALHGTLMGGYTWAQLKDLQIKDTYGGVTYYATLTTVEEYLQICKEYGVKAVLELKWTNGINNNDQSKLPGLIELVKANGMYEDAIFLSSMKNALTFIRNNYPDANVQFLSGATTTTQANVDWCIENRFDLNGPHNVITPSFINQMQAAGLYVNAYTVNTQSVADLLISYGIDMITTDFLGVPIS